ncbi:hypothetical protein [Brachybacterium massiliense]|uniref:hypothetical protein n=1 Tax=Brachybacterium massiliense TaxID=1755098 RepID=UPI000B3BBB31|nr:hypothetical protein [Brachybacterium massiliense]
MTARFVYVPRLIESAEQAEALPIGTCAKIEETAGTGTWYAPPRVNIGRGMWSGDDLYRCSDMVGWTALVPIEAEEGTDTIETGEGHFYTRTRFVTPWEEPR